MDEEYLQFEEGQWNAGFEGGRYVVVGRIWPFTWVFERPPEFRLRFWHSVHELSIRDWKISLEPLHLGQLCVIESELLIRYQPSLRYAREHLEFLPNLHAQLENSLEVLLKDIAEQEIRRMETDSSWLEAGCSAFEKAAADIVNEVLVMRGIHCRCRCRIEPCFAPIEEVDLAALPPWPQHRFIYEEFLRRRREAKEHIIREQTEEAVNERRLLLEREADLLALSKQEEEQREAEQKQKLLSLQAELAAEEARLAEQLESETRRLEEKLRLQEQLRYLQAEDEARAREAEREQMAAEQAEEEARLARQREIELRRQQEQLAHEARLRQRGEESEARADDAEMERHREKLAAEEAKLEEERRHALRQQEKQHHHDALLRQRRSENLLKAAEEALAWQRAELAIEEARLKEKHESELRRHQGRLVYLDRQRQAQIEADIKARETEQEKQRVLEEALLVKQRESEARQREEQLRHEDHLRQLQTHAELKAKTLELEKLRGEMAKVEAQLEQQRECEARQHEEQLRHDAMLRQLQIEQELKEKENRAPVLNELEGYLNREIGLLAMDRQRLKLEEEIREAKLAKTRDSIFQARRRLPQAEVVNDVSQDHG